LSDPFGSTVPMADFWTTTSTPLAISTLTKVSPTLAILPAMPLAVMISSLRAENHEVHGDEHDAHEQKRATQ
jgi:hypothetical protein